MAETKTRIFQNSGASGGVAAPGGRASGRVLLALMLAGLFLAACASGPDKQADQSFYTGQPCAAPCWYGLELGSANKAQLLTRLPTLPFVDAGTIAEGATTWRGDATARLVSFGCLHPKTDSCGSAIFSGDKLSRLQLSINYPLTIHMVVDKLGPPTHLDYTSNPNQPCNVTGGWPALRIRVIFCGADSTVCQALRQGRSARDSIQASSVYYTPAVVLQADPDKCCGRLSWSGYYNP